ncbi:MAG: hypothetical protein U1E14_05110 [Geminicoccaceae bacterium]
MHDDEPVKDEAGSELAPGPLSSRRQALFKLLAGSGAAYAVPLAASFSMGGLTLPSQADAAPIFGNQCFLGNQPLPWQPNYYRIGVRARFSLPDFRSRGVVPAYFLVQIQSILLSDDSGWTARVAVWFGTDDRLPVFLFSDLQDKSAGGAFTLLVSNASQTFALIFPENYNDTRGGGPLVLTRDGIRGLTPDQPYPARPINGASVSFGADGQAWTECGLLRISEVRSNASIAMVGENPSIVPSGALPPANVPSGSL